MSCPLAQYIIPTLPIRRIHHSLLTIFFFFNDTATTEIYTLSLHDALPISRFFSSGRPSLRDNRRRPPKSTSREDLPSRSEEHTSELQSPCNLVCRLLLEKKKYT